MKAARLRTRALIALGLVAFAVRLGFAYHQGLANPPISPDDEYDYSRYAWNLYQGNGYVGTEPGASKEIPSAYIPPGAPVFFVLVYALFGLDNYAAIRVVQCALGAASVLLLFAVARKAASETAGWIAALMLAFYPHALYFSHMLLTETLYVTLVLVLAWLCLGPLSSRPSWGVVAATGAVFAAALLTRPVLMFFVPFYVVWALFVFRGLGDRVRALAVLVLAAALIAPWSAWVSRLYGRFVPVSPVMWSVLIQGNNRVVLEEPRFSGYCVWYTQVPEWASEFEGKSQIEREDVAKRLLLRWLPANRDKWDDLLWNKAVRFWSPFLKQDSRLIRFAMLASWGPVLLLFVPAFFATLAADLRARSPRLWLHAFIASVFLQALIYFAFPRYRFPIEVFCLVFAALTLSWLLARLGLWPRRQTSR